MRRIKLSSVVCLVVEAGWNVMAHAQKPEFVFRRNGRVHLNRSGPHFSQLLAAELCVWAVVMFDTPCSEVVCRVLATHCIRQFPLHFPSRASLCAITFQLESNIFVHMISETKRFSDLNIYCTLNACFYVIRNFFTETFLIIRIIQWDIIIKACWLSCKVPVIFVRF